MKSLPAASVDCVFVDLPYFGVVADDWDNQWKDRNEYLDWVVSLAHEWKRITKSNSSIFVFCDEKMEAYIQVRLDEIFLLLNKIVWFKRNNLPQKNAHLLRTFAPMTERALLYSSETLDCFYSIREYLRAEKEKSGLTSKQLNKMFSDYTKKVGCLDRSVMEHYWQESQWVLPTQEIYENIMQKTGYWQRPYEALRQEYEALRRPFNADKKTWDVIEFPIIGGDENTEHPTTKPLGLYRRILSVITNEGQTILDCCMGSGTAGVAALELGRHFLGCELKPEYFSIAEKRIKKAEQSPTFETLKQRTDGGIVDNPEKLYLI
jgi:site-specific DNA-methyltransferase (adenine-specific)